MAFILNNCKQIKKCFTREINGFFNYSLLYGDTAGMYIKKTCWYVLDQAGSVRSDLCQGKYENKSGGTFHRLFIAPKRKDCLPFNEFGIIEEHKTFEGFDDSERLLDRSQYLSLIYGKKISAMFP